MKHNVLVILSCLLFASVTFQSAEATSPATPTPNDSKYLAGNADIGLIPVVEGEVTVAMTGTIVRSTVPVVVVNGTRENVFVDEISGIGRDNSGSLVAVSEVGNVAPQVIEPGGVGVGSVYFGTSDLPATLSLEFTVASEQVKSERSRYDLEIEEANFVGNEILGIALNPYDFELMGPFQVHGVCFSEESKLTGYFGAYAEKNDLSPGDSTTFEAAYYGESGCEQYLVGSSGYHF